MLRMNLCESRMVEAAICYREMTLWEDGVVAITVGEKAVCHPPIVVVTHTIWLSHVWVSMEPLSREPLAWEALTWESMAWVALAWIALAGETLAR